eukprot:5585191-Amphidinium_carterae.1
MLTAAIESQFFKVGRREDTQCGGSVFGVLCVCVCLSLSARNRWVQCAGPFASYAFLGCVHSLLPRAVLLWLVATETGKEPQDLKIPQCADDVLIPEPQMYEGADEIGDDGAIPWAKWNQRQRSKSKQFLADDPVSDLIVVTVCLQLATHALHVVERVASETHAQRA